MKVVLPFRAEFGIKVYSHVPAVYAMGSPVVCIERGEEALYPRASAHEIVERREDETRARNDYKRDGEREFQSALERRLATKYPGAEFVRLRRTADVPRERFIPRPIKRYGITCDVVVCPRKRDYGHNKNWPHWSRLTEDLQDQDLDVFAGGAPDSSFKVPCEQAWDYPRFLDATLEAMHSAKLVVATDAGLAHLAVLAGRPLLMITYRDGIVAPGPNTNEHGNVTEKEFWPVRMHRYEEGNHTGSLIRVLYHAWEDPDMVVREAVREVEARTP